MLKPAAPGDPAAPNGPAAPSEAAPARTRAAYATDLQAIIAAVLRLADLVVVVVSAIIAYRLRNGDFAIPAFYVSALLLSAVLCAQYFQFAGVYRVETLARPAFQIGRVSVAWSLVVVSLIAFAFLTKTSENFSRVWLVTWFAMGLGGLLAVRVGAWVQLARWRGEGKLTQNVVVFGAGDYGQRLIERLVEADAGSIRLLGVFDRRRSRVPETIHGVPLMGDIEALVEFTRTHRVDEIIVALPWRTGGSVVQLLQVLKTLPANVRWCPEAIAYELPVRSVSEFAGLSMLTLLERPISGWNLVTKAVEDRVGAAVLLVALAPLLLIIALAVRIETPGPIFFRQRRYGFNNEEFVVYKFRSMHHDPHARAQNHAQTRETLGEDVPQARREDPRVTHVGRFLRRTSLDELPQLWNVLRGDMSLVGPRPHAVAHNERYGHLIDAYFARHKVKPGMTGWAQVHGLRGETDTPEKMRRRVEFDLYYIDNWSIALDVKILVMTLFVGFLSRNAY